VESWPSRWTGRVWISPGDRDHRRIRGSLPQTQLYPLQSPPVPGQRSTHPRLFQPVAMQLSKQLWTSRRRNVGSTTGSELPMFPKTGHIMVVGSRTKAPSLITGSFLILQVMLTYKTQSNKAPANNCEAMRYSAHAGSTPTWHATARLRLQPRPSLVCACVMGGRCLYCVTPKNVPRLFFEV
jgi:hypothetical protein